MTSTDYQEIIKNLNLLADKERADRSKTFFKTNKGGYAENDQFIGISVPSQRKLAKRFRELGLVELGRLIDSPIHEYRMTGLLILIEKYHTKSVSDQLQQDYIDFYLLRIDQVNNWDLVDNSCYKLLGDYLWRRQDLELLYHYANLEPIRENLWKNRIAIVTTLAFIRHRELEPTFELSRILISHPEDLIQKAVGWMLRESGKFDQERLEIFLNQYAGRMPRTMLRYAIERFNPDKRKFYLSLY
ncbi:DNA alkylation repair protein [Candidatus Saccharibacteria bacterium]|nr:DNA alkylation repair protein [Candidatus Saccharibacteria bacterium]